MQQHLLVSEIVSELVGGTLERGKKMKRLLSFIFLLVFPLAAYGDLNQAKVKVKIIPSIKELRPGSDLKILLKFDIDEGWHIYGEKPGTFGLPTKLQITLSGNTVTPGWDKQEWPKPEVFKSEEGESFGYRGSFPVYLGGFTVPQTSKVGETLPLKLKAKWLECSKEVCIPRKIERELSIPVVAGGPPIPTEAEYKEGYEMIALSQASDL